VTPAPAPAKHPARPRLTPSRHSPAHPVGPRCPVSHKGWGVEVTSVRYLGRFMPDPRQVPAEVAEHLAELRLAT